MDRNYAGKFEAATLLSTTGSVIEHVFIANDGTVSFTQASPGLYLVELYGKGQSVITKLVIASDH